MRVIIVGGGIGGLTTALMLHARGVECRVFERSADIRELGVGINTLPHAIRELRDIGLLERLDAVGLRTHELFYLNRQGQEVWHELRGMDAGHDVPQFSIHRGMLLAVICDAARERLGPDAIRTDRRLTGFEQDADGVSARFADASGAEVETARGEALIGADGIHSTVRASLYPDEGPPRWNGTMLWRGARDWPAFATGRSMVIAGGMQAKAVVYPIGAGSSADHRLTNWAVMASVARPGAPPRGQDWSLRGRRADVEPHLRRIAIPQVDVHGLVAATDELFEYPLCDRDPVDRWSHGRVTFLGDAAHPMYPVGSNGASQAILDAVALADALASTEPVDAALRRYEAARLQMTADIVHANRSGGPEGVIDAVEALAPDGFDDVDAVLPHAEREAIVRGYARRAGFAVPTSGRTMTDVIRAADGVDGIAWSILGQTYVPKHVDDESFAWHATFPPGTFVPPHVHPAQDEFVYVLEGAFNARDAGRRVQRRPGRPPAPAPRPVARDLQSRRRDRAVAVLGGPHRQAVRPVRRARRARGADARRGRRARGRARRPLPGLIYPGASRDCSARDTCSTVTTPRRRPSVSTAISAPRRRSDSEPSRASSGASARTWPSAPTSPTSSRIGSAPSSPSAACSTAARWATPT